MKMWTGDGAFQWEAGRTWNLAQNAGEFCRGEGALLVPSGLTSFSVFLRQRSHTGTDSVFTLKLWTTPLYFNLLDTDISSTASEYLVSVATTAPVAAIAADIGLARMYGSAVKGGEPMGTVLFWEVRCTAAAGVLVGDISLVANHAGIVTGPRFRRTLDGDGGSSNGSSRYK